MYDKKLYETAYALKEDDQGIYTMNEFCSSMEKEVSVDDIPDLMRLYSDGTVNTEQNEFVTEVINKAVLINPKLASHTIINNINILIQEEAIGCITYLFLLFIYWNEDITDVFLDALVKANISDSNIFISELEYELKNDYDELYNEFLKKYYTLKALQ